MSPQPRVFSGIQPTARLHVGNYLGAIQNWVRLQEDHECLYSIVDYHAVTQGFAPAELPRRTLDLAAELIACGIDPERSILFVQSHVPEHTELAWVLNCVVSFGDLTRMTQFKDKSEGAEHVSGALFSYPVLQAADILLYRAARVPVGEDQVQHLELTRRIGRRFNALVGRDYFPEVEPFLSPAPRIMSLADPSKKMSKSLGPSHFIGLTEDPDAVWKKLRSAVTDVGGPTEAAPGTGAGERMSPGVENLFLLLRTTAPAAVTESYLERYRSGEPMYGDLKQAVRYHLEETLRPMRERRAELDDRSVRAALRAGAERAGDLARRTMADVRDLVGVGPVALDRASGA
ncbi:MAG TPA: tryptophan--tRNA ligase [Thermoanaerobaculia bacterium]|nr:tryptophan--tRNA ligase [Thermoanaerobaculia bacterium]